MPFLRFDRTVGRSNAHWKLDAIERFAGERPLAWVDDALDQECREWAAARAAPTLLVQTDPRAGLTEMEVAELTGWARRLAAEERQRPGRRRRPARPTPHRPPRRDRGRAPTSARAPHGKARGRDPLPGGVGDAFGDGRMHDLEPAACDGPRLELHGDTGKRRARERDESGCECGGSPSAAGAGATGARVAATGSPASRPTPANPGNSP